jgi:hypothetical protein
VASNIRCYSVTGLTDYCPPNVYRAEPSHLFHNNANGTFTDVTAKAGMSAEYGAALGVATADFNGDGWIDLHVSNDSTPNQLWINQHNGTFKNTALLAGTAVGPEGEAKASMGVDAGDVDNDGDEDLVIGELLGQGADLYVNDGTGTFTEESARSRLRVPTLAATTFGAGWLDVDNDGWLDLLTANGAVTHSVESLARQERFALQQKKQLFHNLGSAAGSGQGVRFEDVTERGGPALTVPYVGRGLAFGDLDNDGDTDLVIGNDAGPVQVLLNVAGRAANSVDRAAQRRDDGDGGSGRGAHWLGLRLQTRTGRDALDARVRVKRTDGTTVMRRARADGSYASSNDPRVLIGLGPSNASDVDILWPDGQRETRHVEIDRYTTMRQGAK